MQAIAIQRHTNLFGPVIAIAAAAFMAAYISAVVFSIKTLGVSGMVNGEKPAPKAQVAYTKAKPTQIISDKKSWSQDFSHPLAGPLPLKDWNYDVGNKLAGYHNEAEFYTRRPENVRIEDGALVIEARRENYGNMQYTSGRINTLNKFAFTYGKLEVDMKLPSGTGTWPAAWLMPSKQLYKPQAYDIKKDDPFGWGLNGEIDFAESIGAIPGQVLPAAHSYNELQRQPNLTPIWVEDAYTTYHRYGIIKKPDSLVFTLDSIPYAARYKNSNNPLEWPYNQPYYLILNLAMGGNWAGAYGIDNSTNSWDLKIRSISYTPLSALQQ